MKHRLYRLLVNRVPAIRDRFLQRHPGSRWKAAVYLLWLNARYYLSFGRACVGAPLVLYDKGSESSLSVRQNPEAFARELAQYDVVSFDVFDTLLFRPLSHPTDLFFLVGMDLQYPDFRRIRIETERSLRKRRRQETGSSEIAFSEIWEAIEKETGIPKETGMSVEWKWERRCCMGNPYMLRVVAELKRLGKPVLAVSDMYLGGARVRQLLEGCGYSGLKDYFVSSDYGVSKSGGGLYRAVLESVGPGRTLVHIGDNRTADYDMPRKMEIPAVLYPHVHQTGGHYRTADMSAMTGSLYRGLVNLQLHNGLYHKSRDYEYGFVYGGLFAVGYCRFIHDYAEAHHLDKLLFLSRDGAVLLQAYRLMYPDETRRAEYAYWSRLAALKVTARHYKAEYFRRFLFHKVDQGFTLSRILEGMELPHWTTALCREIGAAPDELLTYKNVGNVKSYLCSRWEEVLDLYAPQVEAGGLYYRGLLQNSRRAAAVDIGWAGSGAVMLDDAVSRLWKLDCPITGILAGTLSGAVLDADGMEPFLFSGRLVSYLYSAQTNRDLWKIHDPAQNHNLYWELLLGAPEGGLQGFYPDGHGGVLCRFKDPPVHADRITAIHEGILDFVRLFLETECRLKVTIPISGRDAYAPMLCITERRNRSFRKGLEALLDETHIG